MANVYEALQRAERERERRISGEDMGRPAAPPSPREDAPRRRSSAPRPGLLRRMFGSGASVDIASEINKRRISILQPESFVAEQYRTLRGRIDSLATQRRIETLAVVSANSGEGKSSCAINLAAMTALSVDKRVLLIDCDLRRPKVHTSLGIEPKTGLAEILLGQSTLDEAIVPVEGLGLDVVAVRNQPPNPSELLASDEMRQLVASAAERYDRVILDTPAALGLPDAKIISEYTDGIVMVVRADVTPRQDVQEALELLDPGRVLGMVINGTALSRRQYGYY